MLKRAAAHRRRKAWTFSPDADRQLNALAELENTLAEEWKISPGRYLRDR